MHYQLSRLVVLTAGTITHYPGAQSPTVAIQSFLSILSQMTQLPAIVFPPKHGSNSEAIRAVLKRIAGLRVCHAVEGGFQHSRDMDFE